MISIVTDTPDTIPDPFYDFVKHVLQNQKVPQDQITQDFEAIMNLPDASVEMILRFLIYVRDIHDGLGQRRAFRICAAYLAKNAPYFLKIILPLIPKYERWDDVLCLIGANPTSIDPVIIRMVQDQINQDAWAITTGASCSLLAKWMPSANSRSHKTRAAGLFWCKQLDMSEREYRKLLSTLRSSIHLVESDLSAKRIANIDYDRVPYGALQRYYTCFQRQDHDRFMDYLSAKAGENTDEPATLTFRVLRDSEDIMKEVLSTRYHPVGEAVRECVKSIADTICLKIETTKDNVTVYSVGVQNE